jgi:single-strand DNA-binding protein
MRGIETAFAGTLGRGVELKTSRSGKPYASLALAVVTGKTDDGSDQTTWVRTTVFGETAEEIAASVHKGDRLYIEGMLTLNTWTASNGEQRTGLNCAAWKVKPLGLIGERRPRKPSAPGEKKPSNGARWRSAPPHQPGLDLGAANGGAKHDRPFNDPLPF